MNVIIIEDEAKAAELLEQMLININDRIIVQEKCPDLPSGVRSINKHKPDLVFLDVELPVFSGLQLLDFFSKEDINFGIIFTTASNKHAVHAFEMSAIDYILKPIDEEKLKLSIEKFIKQKRIHTGENISILKHNMQLPELKKIIVPVINGYEILKLSDIIYLKAEGSYTKIILTGNQSVTVSKNLKFFDAILENDQVFIRVQRSYIANIHAAKKIIRKDGYFLVMEEDIQIPIIAEKVDEIISLINH